MQRRSSTGGGTSSYADSVKDQAAAASSSRRPNNSYVNLLSTPPRNRASNLRESYPNGGAADDRRGSMERPDDRRGSLERPEDRRGSMERHGTTNLRASYDNSYSSQTAASRSMGTVAGFKDDKGLARLFTNLKLLKDSLRQTSAVGADEFDAEVAAEAQRNNNPTASADGASSGSSSGADTEGSAIREATWMVKRAISEFHVAHSRRKSNQTSGSDATSASALSSELALANELTEAKAELAAEKRARRSVEKQMAKDAEACAAQLAAAASAEADARAAEENANARVASAEAAAQEGEMAAVQQARREGEVACQKLASRLAHAEAKLAEYQQHHSNGAVVNGSSLSYEGPPGHQHEDPSPSLLPPVTDVPYGTASSKEPRHDVTASKRVQQLEKAMVVARRREHDLTAHNTSLEAKVERLTKDLKGARPAPISRAKVADLEKRAVESEQAAARATKEAAEAQAMLTELQTQVGELSVARAEKDEALRESRRLHDRAVATGDENLRLLEALRLDYEGLQTQLSAEVDRADSAERGAEAAAEAALESAAAADERWEVECEARAAHAKGTATKAGAVEVAAVQVKLDAALTELAQTQEARTKEAEASTQAASAAEAKIQAIEEREAKQIDKARRHCEELAVSLQETEGSLEAAEARVVELTSKLKESQNARLDLQVRLHDASAAAESSAAAVVAAETAKAKSTASFEAQLCDLREELAKMRALEDQVDQLLSQQNTQAAEIDQLRTAKEELSSQTFTAQQKSDEAHTLLVSTRAEATASEEAATAANTAREAAEKRARDSEATAATAQAQVVAAEAAAAAAKEELANKEAALVALHQASGATASESLTLTGDLARKLAIAERELSELKTAETARLAQDKQRQEEEEAARAQAAAEQQEQEEKLKAEHAAMDSEYKYAKGVRADAEERAASAARALSAARAEAAKERAALEKRNHRLEVLLSESRAKESEAAKQLTIARKNLARRNEVAKIPINTVSSGNSISPTPPPARSRHSDHQNAVHNHLAAEDEDHMKGTVQVHLESPTRRKQLFPSSFPPPPPFPPPSSGPSSSQPTNSAETSSSANQVDCVEFKIQDDSHGRESMEHGNSPQRKRRVSATCDDADASKATISNAPDLNESTGDNTISPKLGASNTSPPPAHSNSTTGTGEESASFGSSPAPPMTAEVYLRTRRRSAEIPPSHRRASSPKAIHITSPLHAASSFSPQPLSQAAAPATVASAMATAAAAATASPDVAANNVESFFNTPQSAADANNSMALATAEASATNDLNQSAAMDELRRALGAQQEQIERLVASQQQQPPLPTSSQVQPSQQAAPLQATSSVDAPAPFPAASQPNNAFADANARASSPRADKSESSSSSSGAQLDMSLQSPPINQRNSRTPDLPVTVASPMAAYALPHSSAALPPALAAHACQSVWDGLAHHCLGKRAGGRSNAITVQKAWSLEFDRARTNRNTPAQFTSGLARCGLTPPTVSSADAAIVFKEMLVARRTARTSMGQKEAPNSMLDGTVGAGDFTAAAARWLPRSHSPDDLSALGVTGALPASSSSAMTTTTPPTTSGASSSSSKSDSTKKINSIGSPPPWGASPDRRCGTSPAETARVAQQQQQQFTPMPDRPLPPPPASPTTAAAASAFASVAPDSTNHSNHDPSTSSGHGSSSDTTAPPPTTTSTYAYPASVPTATKPDVLDNLDSECTFEPRLATRERRGSSGYALSNKRDTSPKKNHSPARKSQQSSNTVAWNSRAAAQRTTSPKKGDTKRVSSGGGGGADRGRQATGRASRESRNKEVEVFNLADALGHIVGQDALKEQMLAFERGIELQARRKELGIACQNAWPPHMMFCGNPGTGKTTIARLVGLVLKKLGVLKKGHLVEVQRADLVAGAIGQTALKTRERLKEAQGGVLFVDEAYTLAPGGMQGAESKDFGREAINEIMAVMNDGDPVVIFAGYEKEMQTFVHANAGLFRRIDVRYDFANYSCDELATILRHEVSSGGFNLDDAPSGAGTFDKQVAMLLDRRTSPELRAAMNGGLARQLFRKARGKLDAELSLDASPEEMTTLTLAHLDAALYDIAPPPPTPP